MSKFSNVERVVNYAIQEGVGVPAAALMARSLLGIVLSEREIEQAESLHANFRRANWQNLERERRQRMYDTRWVD